MGFNTVEEAIEDIRQGRIVIVVDDEDRENEGDLTVAAAKVTPDTINFMAKYGRGLICLALTGERLDELQLPMMVGEDIYLDYCRQSHKANHQCHHYYCLVLHNYPNNCRVRHCTRNSDYHRNLKIKKYHIHCCFE